MGINRNNDRKADQVKDFRDERVCKFYLTGMCPHGACHDPCLSTCRLFSASCAPSLFLHFAAYLENSCHCSLLTVYACSTADIFVNTKMDEGPCPKVHSEALKLDFQRHNDPYMFDSLLEKEFAARITEADRIIKRARMRVEDDKIDESINPDINPEVLNLNSEITKVVTEAENAYIAEDIDRLQELILGRYDELAREKTAVVVRPTLSQSFSLFCTPSFQQLTFSVCLPYLSPLPRHGSMNYAE